MNIVMTVEINERERDRERERTIDEKENNH